MLHRTRVTLVLPDAASSLAEVPAPELSKRKDIKRGGKKVSLWKESPSPQMDVLEARSHCGATFCHQKTEEKKNKCLSKKKITRLQSASYTVTL